jgi:hypothetical protein
MRPHLPRSLPTAIAQCFHSAPAGTPTDPAAPEPVASLSMQLQGHEPTWGQKVGGRRLFTRIAPDHVRSRTLVKSELVFRANGSRSAAGTVSTRRVATLLHSILEAAPTAQGKEALKRAIFEGFKDRNFVDHFQRFATCDAVYDDISRLATHRDLGRAIDLAFAEHIDALVAAALDKDLPQPESITSQVGMLVQIRANKRIKAPLQAQFLQKREEAIDNSPLVKILNVGSLLSDFELGQLSEPHYHPDKVTTLFEELLACCIATGDEGALKAALGSCFENRGSNPGNYRQELMAQFSTLACCTHPAGQEPPEVKVAAAVLTNLNRVHEVLDRVLRVQILHRVQELRRGGARSSAQGVAVAQGRVGLLVEARAQVEFAKQQEDKRREEGIQNHPIQQVLDVGEFLRLDKNWERALDTSYGVPCAPQVAELVGELLEAATLDSDKDNLKRAVGHILGSIEGLEGFADVAHQQSQQVGQAAQALAKHPQMRKFLNQAYAAQIAQYVAAHTLAAGSGTAPKEVAGVGGRARLLVTARADQQVEAARITLSNAAGGKRQADRIGARHAKLLVDARLTMSQELGDATILSERREHLTNELDGHEQLRSTQERDHVLLALNNLEDERARRTEDMTATVRELREGWPLPQNGALALDQVIRRVRAIVGEASAAP